MALERYSDTLRDARTLRPIAGALVSVIAYDGSLATIYDDDLVEMDNPFLTGELGEVVFQATPGRYGLSYNYGGRLIQRDLDAVVGDVIAAINPSPANAGKFVALDADGYPAYSTGTGADAGLRTDLAGPYGSGLSGFIQAGTGAIARSGLNKLREAPVSPEDFGAVRDGVTDDTAAIQRAINTGRVVYLQEGIYRVNTNPGLKLLSGTAMVGQGRNRTILQALPGGGSPAQLAGYVKGSVFGRTFDPDAATLGDNPYVSDVYLGHFAVVLEHPSNSVTATQQQIAIDLRNITRSVCEHLHVGNLVPIGGPLVKTRHDGFDQQGYLVVTGTKAGTAYSGGEVNTLRNCQLWGAYRLVAADDSVLSPASAAHALTMDTCDLQGGHDNFIQESQYTTGCTFIANTIQYTIAQSGNVNPRHLISIGGYNNLFLGGYIEAGSDCSYILRLVNGSQNNTITLSGYSATAGGLITDEGSRNTINCFENTDTGGGVDSFGEPLVLYDRGYKAPWVKFHWDGSSVVLDGGQGSSVLRNGVGDYTVTWLKAFPSDDYALSVAIDGDLSGNLGGFAIGSHGANAVRIFTYVQNGGTTTQLDPRYVWVRAEI